MNIAPAQLAIFALVSAVLGGGLVAWAWLASRLMAGVPLLKFEPRKLVPWMGVDLLLVLAIYILAQVLAGAAIAEWAGIERQPAGEPLAVQHLPTLLLANVLASAATLGATVTLLVLRVNATPRDLGIVPHKLRADIRLGIVAYLAAAPLVYVVQYLATRWIEYDHPMVDAMLKEPTPATMWLVAINAVITAPLLEELLFRVVLQGWLEKVEIMAVRAARGEPEPPGLIAVEPVLPATLIDETVTVEKDSTLAIDNSNPYQPGTAKLDFASPQTHTETGAITVLDLNRGLFGLPLGLVPILGSSLLFALIHFGQGPAPIPLFLLALVLGFLYHRTHRIVPSLVVHMALNGVTMLMLWLSRFIQV